MEVIYSEYEVILAIGELPSAYTLLRHKTTGEFLVLVFPLTIITEFLNWNEHGLEVEEPSNIEMQEWLLPYTAHFTTPQDTAAYIQQLQVPCNGSNIYDCPACNGALHKSFIVPALLYLANPDSYNAIMSL